MAALIHQSISVCLATTRLERAVVVQLNELGVELQLQSNLWAELDHLLEFDQGPELGLFIPQQQHAMLVLQRAMCPTDADVLHDDLWGVVPADEDLLVAGQRDNVLVELLPSILHLAILKLSIWRLEGGKVQKRVRPAVVFELVGQHVFAQLTVGLLVGVEFAVLILTFGEVIGDPVFQTQEVNVLDGPGTFAQT